jgi:hypothetical protein
MILYSGGHLIKIEGLTTPIRSVQDSNFHQDIIEVSVYFQDIYCS